MFKSKFSLSEKQIESSILEYLSFKKIFAWKQNTIGVFDQDKGIYRKPSSKFIIKGISDILAIGPLGRLIAIEVKTPARKKNLTDYQRDFLNNVNASGGLAFVATSLEDVKVEIDKLNRREGDSRPLTADPPNILYPHP